VLNEGLDSSASLESCFGDLMVTVTSLCINPSILWRKISVLGKDLDSSVSLESCANPAIDMTMNENKKDNFVFTWKIF
jgi:hypothetical protein